MAYQFVRTSSSYIEFSGAPIIGYTFGPLTWAIFFKAAETFSREYFSIRGAGDRAYLYNSSTDLSFATAAGANASAGPTGVLDTSSWMLLVVTCAGTGSTPRFHVHKGTSWAHTNASGVTGASAIVAGDTIRLATRNPASSTMSLDIVCAGIKKADSADLTVETLSRTLFSAWQAFGFDWLVGLDTSLTSGGVIQDQASPGTGDEVAKVSTSVVSDPPSWAWTGGAAPTFVPQIVIT